MSDTLRGFDVDDYDHAVAEMWDVLIELAPYSEVRVLVARHPVLAHLAVSYDASLQETAEDADEWYGRNEGEEDETVTAGQITPEEANPSPA